jgi:hypothetical protein
MNQKNFHFVASSILGCIIYLLCSKFIIAQSGTCSVSIIDPPRNGAEVGKEMVVKGIAYFPSGLHLWVLVRRSSFKGVWWPQGDGEINPETHEWKVPVTFGESKDIGWDFNMGVIVVNEKDNIVLQNYMDNAMQSGEWRPIKAPPSLCPPKIITVRKVNHD